MEVLLREVEERDLSIFFEHQIDPVAVELVGFESRNRKDFDSHWKKILADPAITKKTILYAGRVVGFLVCFERDKRLEVGYWIGREYWGRGITSRALPEFLRLEPRRPLYGIVARHNAASIRLLQKNGFTPVESVSEKEVSLVLAAPGQGASRP